MCAVRGDVNLARSSDLSLGTVPEAAYVIIMGTYEALVAGVGTCKL